MDTRTTATTTTTTTATSIDGLLALLWLASPALPVGGFSYSEGLEAAVDAGIAGDEAQCAEWLSQQLHLALARADLEVDAVDGSRVVEALDEPGGAEDVTHAPCTLAHRCDSNV